MKSDEEKEVLDFWMRVETEGPCGSSAGFVPPPRQSGDTLTKTDAETTCKHTNDLRHTENTRST